MRKIKNKSGWDRFVRDLKENVGDEEAIFFVSQTGKKLDGQFRAERHLPSGDYETGKLVESDEFDFREITDEHTLGQTPDEYFNFLSEKYAFPFLIGDYFGVAEWL